MKKGLVMFSAAATLALAGAGAAVSANPNEPGTPGSPNCLGQEIALTDPVGDRPHPGWVGFEQPVSCVRPPRDPASAPAQRWRRLLSELARFRDSTGTAPFRSVHTPRASCMAQPYGSRAAPRVEMGGTGLEPVTPSLSRRGKCWRPLARVRSSL